MTQATDRLGAMRASEARIVGTVSAAHFVSHFNILVLPPLFAFVRADYDVSYTELGFALVAFNIASAVLQTPAGFLVDRVGARIPLIAGLFCGVVAFAGAGLIHSFWLFVAMFALAGVGNAVYHPANYALLSKQLSPAGIGRAYSIHTFAGMLGSAVAPISLLLMQSVWGWRGAFLGAAALGLVVALLVMVQPGEIPLPHTTDYSSRAKDAPAGWPLLLSTPILLNFLMFTLLALINSGLQNYSVVALGALYDTPVASANIALSGYLLLGAGGVLIGGVLAGRITGHGWFAGLGVVAMIAASSLILAVNLGDMLVIVTMSVAGFFYGVIMPSRDMLVRAMTPPGAFGKVFGFVTTGFNVAGIIAPIIFGLVMDHGSPRLVFGLVGLFGLLSVTVIAAQRLPRIPASAHA
jgi:MFS family permease